MESVSADASIVQPEHGTTSTAGVPSQPEEITPRCFCGATVRTWSALLEQGFCSDEHYEEKAGKSAVGAFKYISHGRYEAEEAKQ
jgi:hypothetical protein